MHAATITKLNRRLAYSMTPWMSASGTSDVSVQVGQLEHPKPEPLNLTPAPVKITATSVTSEAVAQRRNFTSWSGWLVDRDTFMEAIAPRSPPPPSKVTNRGRFARRPRGNEGFSGRFVAKPLSFRP